LEKIILELIVVQRDNKQYQEIRNRHYVENNGTHGQQIHFLITDNSLPIGIISGASSVYGVKSRDEFFCIPKDKTVKQKLYLPALINNTVFRLELHEKNLATQILSQWRKTISKMWEYVYDIPVIGFETFVVEENWRKGTLYKADNWTFVGETFGSTKKHNGLGNKQERIATNKKLIYCKWNSKRPIIPKTEYISSWKNETEEEKNRNKLIKIRKNELLNQTILI
jgi:hypothetical protein